MIRTITATDIEVLVLLRLSLCMESVNKTNNLCTYKCIDDINKIKKELTCYANASFIVRRTWF